MSSSFSSIWKGSPPLKTTHKFGDFWFFSVLYVNGSNLTVKQFRGPNTDRAKREIIILIILSNYNETQTSMCLRDYTGSRPRRAD